MNHEEKIADWLNQVKFRKKILGGVQEQDVWNKLRELHSLYLEAIVAERIRYDTLLEQTTNSNERASEVGNNPFSTKMEGGNGG